MHTTQGVAQGSVLSPLLFNVFLDHALRISPVLNALIKRGELIAYADDIAVCAFSMQEIDDIISEFDKLESEWGLKLNKNKCEVILKNRTTTVMSNQNAEFKVSWKAKFLGMNISSDESEIKKDAKTSIRRNLQFIKWKLRGTNVEVKE